MILEFPLVQKQDKWLTCISAKSARYNSGPLIPWLQFHVYGNKNIVVGRIQNVLSDNW